MSTETHTFENPLEAASQQLRSICGEEASLSPTLDRAAMGRILAHIININRSVISSTRDHLNASKRLKDFSLTFDRLAKLEAQSGNGLAARMTTVADHLRAASEELAAADTIPKWRALDDLA